MREKYGQALSQATEETVPVRRSLVQQLYPLYKQKFELGVHHDPLLPGELERLLAAAGLQRTLIVAIGGGKVCPNPFRDGDAKVTHSIAVSVDVTGTSHEFNILSNRRGWNAKTLKAP